MGTKKFAAIQYPEIMDRHDFFAKKPSTFQAKAPLHLINLLGLDLIARAHCGASTLVSFRVVEKPLARLAGREALAVYSAGSALS
jgi:hypothetical protein